MQPVEHNQLELSFDDIVSTLHQQNQPQILSQSLVNEAIYKSLRVWEAISKEQFKEEQGKITSKKQVQMERHKKVSSFAMKEIHDQQKREENQFLFRQSLAEEAIENESMSYSEQQGGQDNPVFLRQQNVFYSSILYKESPSVFGSLSERYCTLSNEQFTYREGVQPTDPVAGVINFCIMDCFVRGNAASMSITVEGSAKEFIFHGQCGPWLKLLIPIIQRNKHSLKSESVVTFNRFWRNYFVWAENMRVESGDLILFKGRKTIHSIQRILTGGEYDHVAVVFLNCKRDVLLLEANGAAGVGLLPWSKFIRLKWDRSQQKVAMRRLIINRNQAFHDEIEEFVSRNLGKPYNFSPVNLLFGRQSDAQKYKEQYCCSSLVAKLYKKLGLINAQKASEKYLPSDFVQKDIQLQNRKYGYSYFQDQKIVLFS